MILWATWAWAADPLLEGLDLPADAEVVVERGPERWTVTVGDRRFAVEAPRTPEDEQALRALISSLWTDLGLLPLARLPEPPVVPPPMPAPRPRPVEPPPEPEPPLVVLVPLPAPEVREPPPPPPPPEPAIVVPEPRVEVAVGLELVVRDDLWPAGGGWVALRSGIRGGLGGRIGGRMPRTTAYGPLSRLTEVTADLLVWTRPSKALLLSGGFGAAGRWYTWDEGSVAAHAVPRAVAGIAVPVDVGAVSLALGAGMECDLASTEIGFPGFLELLSPIAGKIEVEVSFEPDRGAATSY